MPLFKVSVGSEVPVSAVVVSNAPTEADALAEVRLLQSRARVNWRRGATAIGAIEAPYEIWVQPGVAGSFIVSLYAKIPISSIQTLVAEDEETARNVILDKQANGLIEWKYRGIPVGEYKDPIPTFWVNQQPDQVTFTSIELSALSLYPGQSLTFSSDVSAEETPVGNLEFRDTTTGGTIVSTVLEADPVTVGLAHAQATVVLPAGAFTVGAFYLGSDGYQPSSSSTLGVSVQKIPTSVSITPPVPPIYAGQSVSLSVTVGQAVNGAPKPTGILTLFEGTTVIASTQLDTSTAVPSGGFSLGALPPGTYSFTVQYEGDAIHDGSSNVVSGITVIQVPTTSVLSLLTTNGVALSSSVFSQGVRLSVRVTSSIDGTIPTGTVTFKDGVSILGTAPLVQAPGFVDSNADGILDPSTNASMAFLDVSTFSVSTHPLSAEYPGNASFAASTSNTVSLPVGKASTVVNAFSTNSPTIVGQTAVYDATVTVVPPATVTPFQQYGVAGSVTYSGPVVVNFDASGHAGRSVAGLPVGTAGVTVNFNATGEFNASSVAFNHVVNKGETTTHIFQFVPSPAAWYQNTSIACTVSPNSPATGTVTGTVSFSVNDPIYYGDLFLGTGFMMGGIAGISFSWFILVSQNYVYTAHYNGDSNFNASQDQQSFPGIGYFF